MVTWLLFTIIVPNLDQSEIIREHNMELQKLIIPSKCVQSGKILVGKDQIRYSAMHFSE